MEIVTGWMEIEGQRYYFHEDGSLVAETSEIIEGVKYSFDENCILTEA